MTCDWHRQGRKPTPDRWVARRPASHRPARRRSAGSGARSLCPPGADSLITGVAPPCVPAGPCRSATPTPAAGPALGGRERWPRGAPAGTGVSAASGNDGSERSAVNPGADKAVARIVVTNQANAAWRIRPIGGPCSSRSRPYSGGTRNGQSRDSGRRTSGRSTSVTPVVAGMAFGRREASQPLPSVSTAPRRHCLSFLHLYLRLHMMTGTATRAGTPPADNMGMSSDRRPVWACRRWPSLGAPTPPARSLPNQITHHAKRCPAWRTPHAAPGRPPGNPGNISRDPNAELKRSTVVPASRSGSRDRTRRRSRRRGSRNKDPDKVHCPAWGVVGNMGDSICYARRVAG